MRRWTALLLLLPLAGPARAAPPPSGVQAASGFEAMSPALQALQRDDTQNPAMLWVQDGAQAWAAAPPGGRSCQACHGPAPRSMAGVAARYPAFDAGLGRPLNLAQRVNQCRQRHQGLPALAPESQTLLGLAAYLGLQSRGLPLRPPEDPRLAPWRARGEALYRQRIGQLDLACQHCHAQRAGLHLGGSVIPPGDPLGYPLYRLEWQGMGSLQRRLRGCMSGVRAQPYDWDAPELLALELYLAQRFAGLPLQTPALRP